MNGYFLSESDYKKLGLDKDVDFNTCALKTIIAVSETDLDVELTVVQKAEFAKWFYQNYMDGIVECARQWVSQ